MHRVFYSEKGKKTSAFADDFGPDYYQHKDKIFSEGAKGIIHVYNQIGLELYSIKPTYEKIRVTDKYKKDWYKWLKADPNIRDQYEYYKKNTSFSKYFPSLKKFILADAKLYILTYKIKDSKSEILVFDLNGNLIKIAYIYIIDKTPMETYPITIKSEKLYQIYENAVEEKWELRITKF